MSNAESHGELSHRIAQWAEYIHTEVLTCVRCNKAYLESENIGQWRCFQPVYNSPYADGIGQVAAHMMKQRVYVAADHVADPQRYTLEPLDDLLINVNVISVFRHNVLSARSIVPAAMAFVSSVGEPRPSNVTQTLGLCAVRRYDYQTARVAMSDRTLRFTPSTRPSNSMLAVSSFYHPTIPNGTLLRIAGPTEHLYAHDELRMLKTSHRVTFT